MQLKVLGISHQTAAVEVREQFSLPGELSGQFLRAVREGGVVEEALVLDTCNRTEIYYVAGDDGDAEKEILARIASLKNVPAEVLSDMTRSLRSPPNGAGGTPTEKDASPRLYQHHGAAAVEHLFRVACGLDSQIVGEHQILGQLKEAYRLATQEQATGLLINKAMHWAFRVGKRVHSETHLGRGSSSVAQAAVELAGQVFASLEGKRVLLVGAGQTAQLAAQALARHGIGRITVANRTLENARAMTEQLQARLCQPPTAEEDDELSDEIKCPALVARGSAPAPKMQPAQPPQMNAITLEQLSLAVADVDLIISSTGADSFVLTLDRLRHALSKAAGPLFIMDIAVPRDVEPAIGKLPNVLLYTIDDLDRLVSRNLHGRRAEIPKAQAIVQEEARLFNKWLDSRKLIPTIQLLQRYFELLRQAEVARHGKAFNGHAQELERLTQSLCNKLLHKPMRFINDLPEAGSLSQSLAAADLIRSMFDLDALEKELPEPPRAEA